MKILSEKNVTTRKDHICNACFRRFAKGSKMKVTAIFNDSEVYSWYTFETCTELLSKHENVFADEYGVSYEGCVNDEILEHENITTPEQLLKKLKNETL